MRNKRKHTQLAGLEKATHVAAMISMFDNLGGLHWVSLTYTDKMCIHTHTLSHTLSLSPTQLHTHT